MIRKTKKYIAAKAVAEHHGLSIEGNNQDLYDRLEQNNFQWNCREQAWEAVTEPEATSKFVYVRVMTAGDAVAAHADKIKELLGKEGYQSFSISRPEPCRPPKQGDSRIYIQCLPPNTVSTAN